MGGYMAKLNAQGLARGHKGLMSALLPPKGHVFVSCDLAQGEPVATSHYSQDKNYFDACFGMVGKDPYYDKNLLRIDDIYLMVMSVSPVGKERIRALFDAPIEGKSFVQRWREDKEYIQKKLLKKERQLHKILALGLSYSMGPKKLVKQARDNGFTLTPKEARAFYDNYWELFAGVYRFGKTLEKEYEEQGYLVNEFGYRLKPSESYKCLNYFIQSTVSGIIAVLYSKFFSICDFALYVAIIHDEIIFSVPEDRANEAKSLMEKAVESLNEDLGWTVQVRTGWVVGRNLFEAK
jgi:DNA polymerase I-like protein with 3'-5' exonuclease and polymerase domains